MAAAIEQHHDNNGIIWPEHMAPFQLVIIPINNHRSLAVKEASDNLYQQLTALGIDVLLDDRNERAGVLFADHDLIGIPHRLVVSDRNLAQGLIEYKARHLDETSLLALSEIPGLASNLFSVLNI